MCGGPVQQTPGYQATLQQPGQSNGQFSGTRPWTSVPFMQTYGGQQAPWADLSTQTLAAWNGTQNGAGRFNGNAAARYGFAGPWQQQQDTRQASSGFNTGGGDPRPGMSGNMRYNPMPVSGWQDNTVPVPKPGTGGGEPQPPRTGGPEPRPPVDPMAGFQSLLQQDPRAAAEALNFNPGWFQKNQGAIGNLVGGDLGAWRNSLQPQASNVGAITEDQRALIRQKMGW